MNLTPDDIERRTFAIEDRGYDRDEVRRFLFEVAATVRQARETSATTAGGDTARLATDRPGPDQPGRDPFAQLGAEVAEVLRAAHDSVAGRLAAAELEAALIRERAEADALEVRRQAEVDATWQHDRAKRVLIAAQEQAETIIEEAETQAGAVLVAARDQAEQHAQQVASQARRHAELIVRAEGEALRRLHDAHAGVASAIETLAGAEDRPVVDLTHVRPKVQFGSVAVDMEVPAGDGGNLSSLDPVLRMVRHAVDRAVTGAAEHAAEDDGVVPGDASSSAGPDGDHVDQPDADPSADAATRARVADAASEREEPFPGSGRTFDGTSDMTASV